jgi:hypothetical protein
VFELVSLKLLSQTGVPSTPIDPGHSERERLETSLVIIMLL